MEATREEAEMLVGLGYAPGWIEEIADGDDIAIPPVSRFGNDKALIMVRVSRLKGTEMIEHDENGNAFNVADPHVIYHFIGTDADGIPNHYRYGRGFNVWIKREGGN